MLLIDITAVADIFNFTFSTCNINNNNNKKKSTRKQIKFSCLFVQNFSLD